MHNEHNVGEPETSMSDYTTSLGIEDGIKVLEKLTATVGLNYNTRTSIYAENLVNDEIVSFPKNSSQALNGQVNLSYQLDALKTMVFATVARKTRFATLKDRYSYRMGTAIPNPKLLPENAWNFELGFESKPLSNLSIKPTLFYSKIQDVIQMVDHVYYNNETTTWVTQQQNTGKSTFYGGEVDINYAPIRKLKAGLNYTRIERTNDSNPDIYFTNVPKNKLFIYLQYQLNKDYWLITSWEYNSSRYSTSYGTLVSEYAELNAKLHTKIGKYFSLEGGVNNVLDKNYAFAEGYPEQGRNYFISMSFNY